MNTMREQTNEQAESGVPREPGPAGWGHAVSLWSVRCSRGMEGAVWGPVFGHHEKGHRAATLRVPKAEDTGIFVDEGSPGHQVSPKEPFL